MARIFYGHGRKKSGDNTTNKHKLSIPKIVMPVVEQSDILLEILDARFIDETRNKEIEKRIIERGKVIVYILNKIDLVDIKNLYEKIELENLKPYILFSCIERKGLRDLRKIIKIEAKRQGWQTTRVGVFGYPNTGKSSIINLLMGKKVARTSPEAGFTKGIQKLKFSKGILLLDTPGIIPEKENSNINEKDLTKHAQIGVRTWDRTKDPDLIVYELIKRFPKIIQKFYNIKEDADINQILEELGRRKNFLKKGNQVDIDRTARQILRDWQEGKIKTN